MNTLVIVGKRRPAEKAAERYGLKPFVIPPFLGPIHGDLANRLDPLRGHIVGVLAATEAAVLPAAEVREFLNLPGVTPKVAQLGRDKWLMKSWLAEHDIPMTSFLILKESFDAQDIYQKIGPKVVLKPRSSSGGRDQRVCHSAEDIRQLGRVDSLAETFVVGQEFSVESFVQGGKVQFANVTFYQEKWTLNILPYEFNDPARPYLREQILELNKKIVSALNIDRGMTHAEFYLTARGPVFGEIALRPPGGYLMNLLKLAYEFDPWKAAIACEIDDAFNFPKSARNKAASWVLHPGHGSVADIKGLTELKSLPEVQSAKIKIKKDDSIQRRAGAGEDVGRVIFVAQQEKQLLSAIARARDLLKINMSQVEIETAQKGRASGTSA